MYIEYSMDTSLVFNLLIKSFIILDSFDQHRNIKVSGRKVNFAQETIHLTLNKCLIYEKLFRMCKIKAGLSNL